MRLATPLHSIASVRVNDNKLSCRVGNVGCKHNCRIFGVGPVTHFCVGSADRCLTDRMPRLISGHDLRRPCQRSAGRLSLFTLFLFTPVFPAVTELVRALHVSPLHLHTDCAAAAAPRRAVYDRCLRQHLHFAGNDAVRRPFAAGCRQ